MAYAAVISVKQTIESLLNSSRISIAPPCPDIIDLSYEEVKSLQEFLKRLDTSTHTTRLNALDAKIREAVHEFEDLLESHVLDQFRSQSESLGEGTDQYHHHHHHPLFFSLDLQKLKQDVDSFIRTVKTMEDVYVKESSGSALEEEEGCVFEPANGFGGAKPKRVRLSSNIFGRIRHVLVNSWPTGVISLVGMAGIGKTILAKEIFEDGLVSNYFDYRVWVQVGPKQQLKEILLEIVARINPGTDEMVMETEEKLAEYLRRRLKAWRYLIVLDDMWSKEFCDYLIRFVLVDDNGSRVMLTTRLEKVAYATGSSNSHKIPFMNKEESWCLLREKVFGEELCPRGLEKAGKKIAENCEGLPLTIVAVADILCRDGEMTPEYWNKVAEKGNSVFIDANAGISKVLFPSYNHLPQHLKACFLYMGVFPEKYEIPCSKIVKLWSVEGFLERKRYGTLEYFSENCLKGLASRNLVVIRRESDIRRIKACNLHSSFWHMCNREAGRNKFFHILNTRADGLAEGMRSQRRLCVHNNVLFGIKDVYCKMASVSTARSLLCTGPHHQYPVPLCFGLKLLRVVDALTIRFYSFPTQVLELVRLRFLALTCDGKLPSSISKLWNLQCLIVRRHLSIKLLGAPPSYVPMEMWDMKELKHIQCTGNDLPVPCEAVLPNLLTLLDVSSHSCTKRVLERIPNLKKLGIRIELAPEGVEPLLCFDHISHLHELESLKCVVVNPEPIKTELVPRFAPRSIFPSGLRKLSLSGFGYPWEDMSQIASLRNLQVLKLRCFAFRGIKWRTQENAFLKLEFLLIEDSDLVHWMVGDGSFPRLNRLSFKHCYDLEEIPDMFPFMFRQLELVDCNPLVVTRMQDMLKRRRHLIDFRVRFSWEAAGNSNRDF